MNWAQTVSVTGRLRGVQPRQGRRKRLLRNVEHVWRTASPSLGRRLSAALVAGMVTPHPLRPARLSFTTGQGEISEIGEVSDLLLVLDWF
jgi:hypothetical protein